MVMRLRTARRRRRTLQNESPVSCMRARRVRGTVRECLADWLFVQCAKMARESSRSGNEVAIEERQQSKDIP